MIIKTVIIQVLACNGNQLPCIRFFMTNNDMLDKFEVSLKKCYLFNCCEDTDVFSFCKLYKIISAYFQSHGFVCERCLNVKSIIRYVSSIVFY